MKKFKKIASVLLALVMLLALTVPAMAASNPNGEAKQAYIQAAGASTSHSYKYYQIFTANVSSDGSDLVSQTIKWGDGVNVDALIGALQTPDADNGWTQELANLFSSIPAESEATETDPGVDWSSDEIAQQVANIIALNFNPDRSANANLLAALFDNNEVLAGDGTPLPANVDSGYIVIADSVTTTIPGEEGQPDKTETTTTHRLQQVLGQPITITVKSDDTTFTKKLFDPKANAWQDAGVFDIGDTVDFQLTMTVPDDFNDDKYKETDAAGNVTARFQDYEVTFHDVMSSALTFGNDVQVFVQRGTGDADEVLSSQNLYTVVSTGLEAHEGKDTACTFEVQIPNLRDFTYNETALQPGDKIIVKCSAVLNDTAALGQTGNPNTGWVTTPDGDTPEDTVKAFTLQVKVDKVDGEGNPLAGAGFTLYRWISGEDFTALVNAKLAEGKPENYDPATATEDERNDAFMAVAQELELQVEETGTVEDDTGDNMAIEVSPVTVAGGYWQLIGTIEAGDTTTFEYKGVKDGWYKLVESEVPAGYNKADDAYFTIDSTVTPESDDPKLVTLTTKWTTSDSQTTEPTGTQAALTGEVTTGTVATQVVNRTGVTLPSTGGIGTTIFYVGGGILVVAAGILLVVRKRMGGED